MALGPAGYLLVAAAVAGLVVRRRSPLVALGVSFAAAMVYLGLGYPYGPILQLASIAMYSVAAWSPQRVSVIALVVTVPVYLCYAWWSGGTPWRGFGIVPVAGVWLVLPALIGMAAHGYRRVRQRAVHAERQGHIYQERLRIAREVHDVVGHSLAVINMQAGVALHVLDRRPQRAVESLRAVRRTSAQALEELRAVLAPLAAQQAGDQPDADGHHRPPPGLDQIAELVTAVNQGGLPAALEVSGPRPAALPRAVDLAGYRIVQEALTNTVRHAAATSVTVRLSFQPHDVLLTVTDNGRGGAREGSGRGLAGMRERAVALGGDLAAGPGNAGGFEVRARLPLMSGGEPSTTR